MTIENEIRRNELITQLQAHGFHYDGLNQLSRKLDYRVKIIKKMELDHLSVQIITQNASFNLKLNKTYDQVVFFSVSSKIVSKTLGETRIYKANTKSLILQISEIIFNGIRIVFDIS